MAYVEIVDRSSYELCYLSDEERIVVIRLAFDWTKEYEHFAFDRTKEYEDDDKTGIDGSIYTSACNIFGG